VDLVRVLQGTDKVSYYVGLQLTFPAVDDPPYSLRLIPQLVMTQNTINKLELSGAM